MVVHAHDWWVGAGCWPGVSVPLHTDLSTGLCEHPMACGRLPPHPHPMIPATKLEATYAFKAWLPKSYVDTPFQSVSHRSTLTQSGQGLHKGVNTRR